MRLVDRGKFFQGYRGQFGKLSQEQVNGLNNLLAQMEADSYLTDVRWAAYMLATAKWETGNTFQPIKEYGTREYFIGRYGHRHDLGNDTPEEGATYAGRGFVQITGENNYEMAERALRKFYPKEVADYEARSGKKFVLHTNPDALLDPKLAYCIMSYGMRTAAFTGVGLTRYINAAKCDYLNARKIINGLDQAERIAGFATKFQTILEAA